MASYGGVYDAVVVGNVDPTGKVLLTLQIPALFGRETFSDVRPMLQAATAPAVGSTVYVMFRNGSAAHPVWIR